MTKYSILIIAIVLILANFGVAQTRRNSKNDTKQTLSAAIVVDDRLSLLLTSPSLYAAPISRLRVGRRVYVKKSVEGDGVTFYQVTTSEEGDRGGYIQSEAVIGNFRRNDDQRLFSLIFASEGFERFERTAFFVENFPNSKLIPTMLLLLGDLVEEECAKLSADAAKKLDRREMAASGAPLHSFYLSYSGLDRYRKLGVRFLFNLDTLSYHYDGATWLEILDRFSKSSEADEAEKRMNSLAAKMRMKSAQ
ncbi:MAG: hypothetical protein ACK5NT_08400 [Pyrinomonadaceae bacterium]